MRIIVLQNPSPHVKLGHEHKVKGEVFLSLRFVIVDCVGYPYTVFCRQCQVYPYNLATPTLGAPFSTTVVLHHIAQTQVRNTLRNISE